MVNELLTTGDLSWVKAKNGAARRFLEYSYENGWKDKNGKHVIDWKGHLLAYLIDHDELLSVA